MTETPKFELDITAEEQMFNRLRNEDHDAWQQVYLKSVLPVRYMQTRNGISYGTIMQDRHLDLTTLYAMLYEDMIAKKGLEKYRFGCPILFWLRRCAAWLVLKECKEKAKDLSENAEESYYIDRNTRDDWELVNCSFAEIWRKDPMKAYVYFLRRYEKMPSTEIMQLMGISSVDNVDQLFSRANKEMLESLRKHGGRTHE